MKTSLTRAAALSCALLASTALATPALAQSEEAQPLRPPARYNLDENGVDLVSGRFFLSSVDLTIGGGGDSGLQYVRTSGQGGAYDNFFTGIEAATTINVQIGAGTDSFAGVGQPSLHGSGATLGFANGNYIYTTKDGVRYEFDAAHKSELITTTSQGRVARIVYPNGRILTLSYSHDSFQFCPLRGDCTGPEKAISRVESVTSNDGYQLKFEYFPGNFTTVAGMNNWSRVNKVTAINNGVEYCDPTAVSCSLAHPWPSVSYTKGTTVAKTDALGRTTSITYDSGSRIVGVRRASSTTDNIMLSYDPEGRVATFNGGNGTYSYGYVDSGSTRTTTVTNPLSHQIVVVSDLSKGVVTSRTNQLNQTISYEYDANSRLTKVTEPEGNAVQYAYDGRSNVTEVRAKAKPSAPAPDIVTSATYPCLSAVTCDKPATVTDSRGNVTEFTYDHTHGGLATVTSPAGPNGVRPQTRYGYEAKTAYYKNSSGAIAPAPSPIYKLTAVSACATGSTCPANSDELITSLAYGQDGVANNLLPTSVTSRAGYGPLVATQTMAYDSIGNLASVDGPLAGAADTVRYHYNAARQQVGTISPDPDGAGTLKHRAQRTTYNPDGQVTKVETGTANGQSSADLAAMTAIEAANIDYDTVGRKVTETLQGGGATLAVTDYSYDAKGRLDCTAQRMNPATFASVRASACTPETAGSFGPDRISRTFYDAADQVTQQWSAVGTANPVNETTVTYRPNGQAETVTDAENNKTSYEYDGFDRLARTYFPSATKGAGVSNMSDYEQLSYDPAGNVVSRRIRDGQTIGYGYDNLNRLVSKDLPGTVIHELDITYAYDNLGRLIRASDASPYWGGIHLTFAYDALGNKISEGNSIYGTQTFENDAAGRRTRMTWKDGFFVNYDYLTTGEVTAIRENGATSGVGVLASFGYDDLGRRASLTRGNGTVTGYGYDGASRLTQLTENMAGTSHDRSAGFSHNPASQIIEQVRSNEAYTYRLFDNGSTNSAANGLNQLTSVGSTAITHDTKGNVTSDGTRTFVYTAENKLASSPTTKIAYDALGRLYYTSVPSISLEFDGERPVLEVVPGNGQILRRYVHGPGVDEPLVWYEGPGLTDRRFLHADERGSVIAVSDSAGSVTAVNKYDEYGVPASTNIGRFQYTGQTWIPEVGAYYYKARFYNPKLPTFMQTDPIGYGDGMNLYAYVGNDPVNFKDPTGTKDIIVNGPSCSVGVLVLPDNGPLGDSTGWYCAAAPQTHEPRAFGGGGGRPSRPEKPDRGSIGSVIVEAARAAGKAVDCASRSTKLEVELGSFVGLGGAVRGGFNYDRLTGWITAYGEVSVGWGLGFSLGALLGNSSAGSPTSGSSTTDSGSFSAGVVGGSASRSRGGGRVGVTGGFGIGAKISALVSSADNKQITSKLMNVGPDPDYVKRCVR